MSLNIRIYSIILLFGLISGDVMNTKAASVPTVVLPAERNQTQYLQFNTNVMADSEQELDLSAGLKREEIPVQITVEKDGASKDGLAMIPRPIRLGLNVQPTPISTPTPMQTTPANSSGYLKTPIALISLSMVSLLMITMCANKRIV